MIREPDFNNILMILDGKIPKRPTLFEFMIDDQRVIRESGVSSGLSDLSDFNDRLAASHIAYRKLGYDFSAVHASLFHFNVSKRAAERSVSMNEGGVITDRDDLDNYVWNEPEDFSLDPLVRSAEYLEKGMKMMICSPCGVLENVISLVGYEDLCILLHEDEELAGEIFYNVGTRLIRYFRSILDFPFVGGIISNDDWGFNTQTMLSPEMMRKYVFPYHQQIVSDSHAKGKPAVLHSCGNFHMILDDITDVMKFDGRHSYEDNICAVEEAYEMLNGRIAVLGGIDLGMLISAEPDKIRERSIRMLERSAYRGGYALGSGNSITEDIPEVNFKAMTDRVLEN